MKRNQLLLSLTAVVVLFAFASCKKDASSKKTQTITLYTPVYNNKATVLAAINGNASEAIVHAGKIYVKDNFIYLNDVNKGIHVIDNSNASNPHQIAFLAIPGNLDIAVKGNILYADMYDDLLAIDISNPRQVNITHTVPNLFTGRTYVNGHAVNVDGQIAASWIEKDTVVELQENSGPVNCDFCAFEGDVLAMNAAGIKTSGTAGSMAGMVLMDNYLYAIAESHSVGIVNISDAAIPALVNNFFAGFDLETIFPFNGKLFLGSSIGMFVYDVTNPQNPVKMGEFAHGRACDPVITDGNLAYITLHSGDGCGGDANELHVVDVSNLPESQLVKTYQLTKPTGLSKDGNALFVCDDQDVKIYNAANPTNMLLLKKINASQPYDVIASSNRALIVCQNGLYQYDYSDINHIRQLSFLAAKR